MASSDSQIYDDQLLTRYLLGSLPEAEAERLDELSVVDQEFAWRLEAVENDLVDAYVRGELAAEQREQFRKRYLSSTRRREKVKFAGGLLALEQRTPALPEKVPSKAKPAEQTKSSPGFLSRVFSVPRAGLQWGFATAACVLLFISGYLFVENSRLSREIHETQTQHSALAQREMDLERQLSEQKAGNAQAPAKPAASSMELDHLTAVALFLAPPTRGATQLPTLSVSPGTQLVVLSLGLETGGSESYGATLKDLAGNQVVWRGVAHPNPSAGKKAVTVNFPSSLLKQQSYTVELAGQADGRSEIVGTYPFRVVMK